MTHLEELTLYLTVNERPTLIDGNHLENEILIHMPQVQTFTFNITTNTSTINNVNRQSNDEFRRTFLNGKYPQAVCYAHDCTRGRARSHAFSLPYTLGQSLRIGF